jgi:uncharacterized membrane protein YhaH (DUF805 family)
MAKYEDLIRELYSPSGRNSLSNFVIIFIFVATPFIALLMVAVNSPASEDYVILPLILYFMFILFPIQLCNVIKRLHDTGKSGWWWFVALIPYIGPIYSLYLLFFVDATDGPNKYGDKPV